MTNLTGKQIAAAAFSPKDLGLFAYRPDPVVAAMARSAAAPATAFRAAPATGDLGLRAGIGASRPATAESKAIEKIVKSAVSVSPLGKGLVKSFDLCQSSQKMMTAFGDRDPSLLARVETTIDVIGDVVSLAKVPFPQLGDNAIFQVVGHCVTAGAMVCDLWGAATEKPQHLFGIDSAS